MQVAGGKDVGLPEQRAVWPKPSLRKEVGTARLAAAVAVQAVRFARCRRARPGTRVPVGVLRPPGFGVREGIGHHERGLGKATSVPWAPWLLLAASQPVTRLCRWMLVDIAYCTSLTHSSVVNSLRMGKPSRPRG